MKRIIMLGMAIMAMLVSLYGCSGTGRQGMSSESFYNDTHNYDDDGDIGIMRGDNF